MWMQKLKRDGFNDKAAVSVSGILGAIVFLLLYGLYPLDVTNDAWILTQYDGSDILQHYAGWAQYRISDWNYPLGYANELSYGDGTYITYTDSIPYVAIICKLFRGILPDTFQYFGWFTLGCYILQGIGACLLIKRKIRSYVKVLTGVLFFLTAPVLIERTFKHTALAAQWIVLFAIYFYLEYRKKEKDAGLPWQLILLTALSVGIHPYFLPMVMIFVLLVVIEAVIKKHSIWKTAGFTALSVASPAVMGLVIGAIGTGVKNTREGYGYFGMNLNSLFNAQSSSGYTWSHVLPQRGQIYHTYDGFNYLGLGVLLMAAVCFVLFVAELVREKEYLGEAKSVLKRNIPLICCMAFMTLFAVTNVLTWDYEELFLIPIPKELIELASIFRSSGRMFWPVYYLIMLTLIYYLLDKSNAKIGGALLAVLLFIQIFDMRDVYTVRYDRMKELSGKETLLDDETLKAVPEKEVLVVIGQGNFEVQRVLAVWAAQRNMGVAYSVANSGEYINAKLYTDWFAQSMAEGVMREDVVYVTFEEEIMQHWREVLIDDVYTEYQRGFYYFVYKE